MSGCVCGGVARWGEPRAFTKNIFGKRKKTRCDKCQRLKEVRTMRWQPARVDWRNQADMNAWVGPPPPRTICQECSIQWEKDDWDYWYKLHGLNPPTKDTPYPHITGEENPPREVAAT